MEALRTKPTTSSPFTVTHNNSFVLKRLEGCFFRTPKVANFRLLSLVFVKQNRAFCCPVSRASPQTQVDLEEVNNDHNEEIYQSKTVHVKFQLEKECLFGQQFLMVGNDRVLGLWDPETAVPLNWSDQHVWFAELDIPVGKLIEYKFILNDGAGEILWQPGPNRVFQAWETENAIVVSDDWENTELQVITELEQDGTQSDSSLVVVGAEEKIVVGNNSVIADGTELPKQLLVELSDEQFLVVPSQEMPKPIVLESATGSESTSSATSLEDNVAEVEKILGNNGGAGTSNIVDYEGEPVLVPGLPPLLEVLTDLDTVDEEISLDDTVEVFVAEDHSMAEIQLNEQEMPNKQQEKGPSDDETIDNDKQKLKSDAQKMPGVAKTDKRSNSGTEDDTNTLVNDLQWGQKTLRNFFTNLRLF